MNKQLETKTQAERDAYNYAIVFALIGVAVLTSGAFMNNVFLVVGGCMLILMSEGEISRFILLKELRKNKK